MEQNLQPVEKKVYYIRQGTSGFLRFLFWFGLLLSSMRGKLNQPLVPEETGLYAGILLLAALVTLSYLTGRPRSITISDTLQISRCLLPNRTARLTEPVYLGDNAILMGGASLELDDIRKPDDLILWLTDRAEESKLTILPLNPDRPKIVATLGYHRIRPYLPLAICTVYGLLSGAWQLQLLPYGWDFAAVPLVVFSLWYLLLRLLDQRASQPVQQS